MPSPPNPFYDPGWAAKYRALDAQCADLQRLCEDVAAAEGFGSARHRAALERQLQARRRLRAARLAEFPTVAAYAAWRFAAYAAWRFAGLKDGVAVTPDFTTFASLPEVEAAYARAEHRRREESLGEVLLLPTRQPAGLTAFADAPAVISSWRRFERAQMGGRPRQPGLDCMVSFHDAGEALHFCIAQRWGGLSRDSDEDFWRVASVLARQAIMVALPEAGLLFRHGNHRLVAHRALIRAVNEFVQRLHFYRHLAPHQGQREHFCRVAMGWNGLHFTEPDWAAAVFGTLPVALRQAFEHFQDREAGAALALPGEPLALTGFTAGGPDL